MNRWSSSWGSRPNCWSRPASRSVSTWSGSCCSAWLAWSPWPRSRSRSRIMFLSSCTWCSFRRCSLDRRGLPRVHRLETPSAHGLGDAQRLLLADLALDPQGQLAPLPDQGVAGQAGLLVPEVAGGVPVGEEVRLAAEPVAGLAPDPDLLDHAEDGDLLEELGRRLAAELGDQEPNVGEGRGGQARSGSVDQVDPPARRDGLVDVDGGGLLEDGGAGDQDREDD